ncbi:MAG: chromosomal replication initiator protein DnaA [Planctomycetes bacterium]|nr:chromosomal replication initiator protein DnaA [Planctomycetota bacterium]MCB9902639.1 chromosomal replication initiator protein DnaA [Planctomycetota bacterium]
MNERGSAGTLGSAEDRFQQVLGTLQRGMEAQQWRTWFRNMRLGSWADGQLKILLPNRFYQEWFQSKFHDRVRAAAEKHTDGPVQVLFVVEDEDGPSVNGTDGEAVAEPTPAPLFVAPESAPAPSPGWPDDLFDATPINPHYTFRDFVTGPSNEMAYASARGVADEPGTNYNPLFIHGAVGLGKTHLLHAIGNEFRRRFPEQRMCILSCEEFTNAFIHALGHNQVEAFRERLRKVHLLIIDDIHFLANKERTQEEFFNTFNRLHQLGCQIVLSSDAAPSDIPALKERLVSRFNWGLVTCLEQPETETRMAILTRKAHQFGITLPSDVVEFIAAHFRNNIRELEGAVQSVKARADIEGGVVDLALAERALAGRIRMPERKLDIDTIAAAVCAHYQVEAGDLKSRRRTRNISVPRQVAMYLARELTHLSLQEIGAWFGGRDHTTVLFGVQKTEERMRQDPRLAQLLGRLRDRLGAP